MKKIYVTKKKEKRKEETNTSQQEKLSTKVSRVYFEQDLIFYSYCQIYKKFNLTQKFFKPMSKFWEKKY